MGLREQKKEALRQRLYESAMAMFRERGFVATRVRDIIDAAQVSEATFFNYFPTKESVLHHSSRDTKMFYGAYLSNLGSRLDEPAEDRLRELARVVASVFDQDKAFMATILGHTELLFGSTDESKELDLANYELLTDLFRQGQRRREFDKTKDPSQLAEIYSAVELLTIQNWVTDWWGPETQTLESRLLSAVEVVLAGARPQTRSRRAPRPRR